VTRPRAADDFAAIHERLAELRREREQASKQDARDEETGRGGRAIAGASEPQPRPEKGGWPSIAVSRRYLAGRQR
jgi:hypothetical protein